MKQVKKVSQVAWRILADEILWPLFTFGLWLIRVIAHLSRLFDKVEPKRQLKRLS